MNENNCDVVATCRRFFYKNVHPHQVGVLNFNPYFKKKGDHDRFYVAKTYCSEIIEINYPEDILSAEYETSNDVRYYLIALLGGNHKIAQMIYPEMILQ